MLEFIMYLLALICFLVAAASITVGRLNVVALGLAFMVFPLMLAAAEGL